MHKAVIGLLRSTPRGHGDGARQMMTRIERQDNDPQLAIYNGASVFDVFGVEQR